MKQNVSRNSVFPYLIISSIFFFQAASQSTAIDNLHPQSATGSRPRTAERASNSNLLFQARPKSSAGKIESHEILDDGGAVSHIRLPRDYDENEALSPPGVVFQESRANSAMSFIDDPGKKFTERNIPCLENQRDLNFILNVFHCMFLVENERNTQRTNKGKHY